MELNRISIQDIYPDEKNSGCLKEKESDDELETAKQAYDDKQSWKPEEWLQPA